MKYRAFFAGLMALILSLFFAAPANASTAWSVSYEDDDAYVSNVSTWFPSANEGATSGLLRFDCVGRSSKRAVVYVKFHVNNRVDSERWKQVGCDTSTTFNWTYDPTGGYDIQGVTVQLYIGTVSCNASCVFNREVYRSYYYDNPKSSANL